MSIKIENIIKKIVLVENYSQLVEEIMNDQAVELEKIISCAFDNVEQIGNEAKVKYLAEIIACISFKQQSLVDINNQLDSIDGNESSPSKRNLFKKILIEIGHLITKNQRENIDLFLNQYVRLCTVAMTW